METAVWESSNTPNKHWASISTVSPITPKSTVFTFPPLNKNVPQETILVNFQGVFIASHIDTYPRFPMDRYLSPESVVKVEGDHRLLYAACYLQKHRIRNLVSSLLVNPNARFYGENTVLHFLTYGSLPSGFSYRLGEQYRLLINEIITFIAFWPGVELQALNSENNTPLENCILQGLVRPFGILLEAGAAGSLPNDRIRQGLFQLIESSNNTMQVKQELNVALKKKINTEAMDFYNYLEPRRKKPRCEKKNCSCQCCAAMS